LASMRNTHTRVLEPSAKIDDPITAKKTKVRLLSHAQIGIASSLNGPILDSEIVSLCKIWKPISNSSV
jgi:hypothetical protein